MIHALNDLMDDFLKLERCFNREESALFLDDLELEYGPEIISNALDKGILQERHIMLGPDYGRKLCTLTSHARTLTSKG